MGSEWREYKICDVGKVITGKTPPGTLKEYFGGDTLFVTPGDMDGQKNIQKTARTLSPAGENTVEKVLFDSGIVVSCIGWQMGKSAIIKQRAVTNQQINTIIVKQGVVDIDFLYYILKSKREEIFQLGATATRTPIVKKSLFEKVSFRAPNLAEQKKISECLSSLDDKIELNRQMNATLESMAQALFKSWFVDFDPVIDNALATGNPIPEPLHAKAETRKALGDKRKPLPEAIQKQFPSCFVFSEEIGWIPEGWEVGRLSNILEVKYGKDHKKLNNGGIPVYGSGGLMRYADDSLYKGESVLIPRKGTLSNIIYLNEEFWTVDTMFYTIPKGNFIPKYVFYHLKSLDFTSMNVGSAVPSMTTKVLNELPILVPVESVLEDFDSILMTYFDKAEGNNTQSKRLSRLRDTLLPKLLSGELRIPDAEKLLENTL